MSVTWVAYPALYIITIGFAGLLGELIFHLRSQFTPRILAAAMLLAGLVWFPPLSLPLTLQWGLWVSSGVVILLFALRPQPLPNQLFSRQFAMRYASIAMLISALWDVLAGPAFPAHALAIAALLASLLAWLASEEVLI